MKQLKEMVYEANMELYHRDLVIYTWGNVSQIDREKGLVAIKPSGVPYEKLTADMIVVMDLATGRTVEGNLNPSSDAVSYTHLDVYKRQARLHQVIQDGCRRGDNNVRRVALIIQSILLCCAHQLHHALANRHWRQAKSGLGIVGSKHQYHDIQRIVAHQAGRQIVYAALKTAFHRIIANTGASIKAFLNDAIIAS